MDGVFADIAEPWTLLFPGGTTGRAGQHRRVIKDDWQNQTKRSLLDWSMLTLLAIQCANHCISSATAESCGKKSKISVAFIKWGKEGEKNFPVIRNISHPCWGSIPAEIRWFKLLHGGVITAAAADKILNSTQTCTNRLPLNHLLLSGAANSNSDSNDTTALPEMQKDHKLHSTIELVRMRAENRPTRLPHRMSRKSAKYRFYSDKHQKWMLIVLNFTTSSGLDVSCFKTKSKTCKIKMKNKWYRHYAILFWIYS